MNHYLKSLIWVMLSAHLLCAQKADLIVQNAIVYTLDSANPKAQAIAVSEGKILYVGDNQKALALRTEATKVIDAKGKTIIPGIFDSHLHVIRGGRFYHAELRWDGVRSLKTALKMLKEQAQRTPPGQWVRVVGGWNAWQFVEKRLPTLAEINEATGSTPAFILHLYGHAYLNKAGLAKLNINANTLNPAGGLIDRDQYGNPTGLLIAEPNAFLLYSTLAKLPELTPEEQLNSTKSFMRELNRFGITAVMDAGGGFQNYPDDYKISNQLCEQNELSVRLPYFLFAQKAGTELSDYSRWIQSVEIGHSCNGETATSGKTFFGKKYLEYHVQGGGENLVMSAADFENFDQPRPELSPNMEVQLKAVLLQLVQNRWPFRIHATYNESIDRFLNVIEEVDQEVPLDGLIWFFDHAETISESNLQRVKKLGGGIAIQYRMAFQGESFIQRYGKHAAENTPPIKRILELEIPLGMGSDGTRVSSYNPFIGLYWLTTGRTLGGVKHLSDSNILDRKTALELYTSGSAKLIKMEADRGKLMAGYLADFAILSEDYFSVPDEKILQIESLLTILDGKVVYAAGNFSNLDSNRIEIKPGWSPVKYYGGYQNK